MNDQNETTQLRFLEETGIRLRQDGFTVQFNLFDDIAAQEQQHKDEEIRLERERKIQEAMLGIKKKFGKNAILNGGSYLDGATARERNGQIGGHKA